MITQKQIAARAGVSRQLVGYVFQGRPNVAPETARRIRKIAAEMGYHPEANWTARIMLAKRHRSPGAGGDGQVAPEQQVAAPIYLIKRERADVSESDNLIFMDYFNGLIEAFSAWKRGFELTCPQEGQTDLDLVRHIVATGRSSGIINVSLQADAVDYIVERGFPSVSINVDLSARGVPSVANDHVKGYELAWRAAAKAGHRRVAFVGYGPELYNGRNFAPRLRECEAGAAAAGVSPGISHVIAIPEDSEGIWRAFVTACGEPNRAADWPTLVFTQNDLCAKALMSALRDHGVVVPRDLSVIGFDDLVVAKYFDPPLATLSKPRFEMGKAAARLMSDLLAGAPGSRERVEYFPLTFVPRASFAPAPPRVKSKASRPTHRGVNKSNDSASSTADDHA